MVLPKHYQNRYHKGEIPEDSHEWPRLNAACRHLLREHNLSGELFKVVREMNPNYWDGLYRGREYLKFFLKVEPTTAD